MYKIFHDNQQNVPNFPWPNQFLDFPGQWNPVTLNVQLCYIQHIWLNPAFVNNDHKTGW